jgi:rfaE bifunctional protein kinase chain/domain
MNTGQILSAFGDLSLLVVGDICLDLWCRYDPSAAEPSRETGLPRIGVVSFAATAGACGTIANNLADLGVNRVSLLGAIGEDAHGDELLRALGRRNIGADLILRSQLIQTFTYTKHINTETGKEDLPRVDFINNAALPEILDQQLVSNFEEFAPRFDAILICDQAETARGGVVTAALRSAINRFAARYPSKPVWVDSRKRAELFTHCYLKPNEDEAAEAATRLTGESAYQSLLPALSLRALIVTAGSRGALIHDSSGQRWVHTISVDNPVDICGAGDSFSAGAASALAAGAVLDDAVHLGNLVASVTIMKPGTGTATPAEVLAAASRAGRP